MERLAILLLLFALKGCELFDQPKGEIGFQIYDSGKLSQGCLVNVYNDKGVQLQRVSVNQVGVCYVKRLNAGTYTFKFTGAGDKVFPAVRTVTIHPGSSAYLKVNLSQEHDPEGEAAASKAGGKDYGVEDMSP
jgi:hypothetical protein